MTTSDRTVEPSRPAPTLIVAGVLVAAEALALLAVGVSVVLGSAGSRAVLDVTTTVFFAVYGAGLLCCAVGLLRAQRWARAPVVLSQVIQLLVSWSFNSGETRWLAVVLALTSVVALVAVLAPASTRALVGDEPGEA